MTDSKAELKTYGVVGIALCEHPDGQFYHRSQVDDELEILRAEVARLNGLFNAEMTGNLLKENEQLRAQLAAIHAISSECDEAMYYEALEKITELCGATASQQGGDK